MKYFFHFFRNIKNRKVNKDSCTKSGLVPIRALTIVVRILKFLHLYNLIYAISLFLTNRINRRKLITFYSQFVSKDDLCFDIGANVGSRTEVFLQLGARVVSVEPQEKCMKKLEKKYAKNDRVSLVKSAVGESEGEEEMMISNSHVVSSMSKKWIESLKKSDMFFVSTSAFQWHKATKVKVTTLDNLVQKYGTPAFCKIDVEGYEHNVLKGLSKPIGVLSFEFTPTEEFLLSAVKSVKHLSKIGKVKFNYSLAEKMTFALKDWVSAEEISEILPTLSKKTSFCGDIYAKFV
jgi:FkbM family methyltransferase